MGAAAVRGTRRRWLTGAVAVAGLSAWMLLGAAGARATELVYWDNGSSSAPSIGVADIATGSGFLLNSAGAGLEALEGMAYDPVTNRLYLADDASLGGSGQISYVNLDGSGGAPFPAPSSAPVDTPKGVAVDPVARVVYWLNDPSGGSESISWARLDGSEGGPVQTTGALLQGAVRLVVVPAEGRVYWGNGDGTVGFAPLVGGGSPVGTLEAHGAGGITGLAVVPLAGPVFWAEGAADKVVSAGLTGPSTSERNVSGAHVDQPSGLAYDPASGRVYWGNEGNGTDPSGAIGFSGLGADVGAITPTENGGSLVAGPQDPLIIKSPTATSSPAISNEGRELNCSPGAWAPDSVSSLVYEAPRSLAYEWMFNDAPISGANAASYMATTNGRYRCVVIATNPAGSTRASAAVSVSSTVRPGKGSAGASAAKLVLLGKSQKLKAKPGKRLKVKVKAANQGTSSAPAVNACLRVPKKSRRALRAGKCQLLGPFTGGGTASVRLRLQVKRSAKPGVYKVWIAIPDSVGQKVSVRVSG